MRSNIARRGRKGAPAGRPGAWGELFPPPAPRAADCPWVLKMLGAHGGLIGRALLLERRGRLPGDDIDDEGQDALFALWRALRMFDDTYPTNGGAGYVKISTYLMKAIRNAIRNGRLRRRGRLALGGGEACESLADPRGGEGPAAVDEDDERYGWMLKA